MPSQRPSRTREARGRLGFATKTVRWSAELDWLLIELGPGTCHNYLFNLAGKRTLWPLGPSHPQPAPLPRVGRQPIDKTPSGFIVGEIKNSQAGLCQSPGLPRPSLGSPHQGRPSPQVRRGLIRVLALQIGEADVAARMKATSKFTPNRARKPIGLSRS